MNGYMNWKSCTWICVQKLYKASTQLILSSKLFRIGWVNTNLYCSFYFRWVKQICLKFLKPPNILVFSYKNEAIWSVFQVPFYPFSQYLIFFTFLSETNIYFIWSALMNNLLYPFFRLIVNGFGLKSLSFQNNWGGLQEKLKFTDIFSRLNSIK